jgi:sodium-type flagellar protein MotY
VVQLSYKAADFTNDFQRLTDRITNGFIYKWFFMPQILLNIHSVLLSLMVFLLSMGAKAVTYSPTIEDTQWMIEYSVFECYFSQPIAHYGEAIFYHEAGEDVVFFLNTSYNRMKAGEGRITIEAPSWNSSALTADLGSVSVEDKGRPMLVDSFRARRMLAELDDGMAPTLSRLAKFESDDIRVKMSPIKFRDYYLEYQACAAQLLPVNFDQVSRSTVNFKLNKFLDPSTRKKLDNIITYAKADTSITGIYVDGHTDSSGSRYINRVLSEKRANVVTDYLIKNGLPPALILTRYHGERYPKFTNKTASGRAKNRRVTIRLERNEKAFAALSGR